MTPLPSRPPRLLVLACSATRRSDPGRIPAFVRYDGPLYLDVIEALLVGFVGMGCVRPQAGINVINGPISQMRRDLLRWLLRVADPAPGERP